MKAWQLGMLLNINYMQGMVQLNMKNFFWPNSEYASKSHANHLLTLLRKMSILLGARIILRKISSKYFQRRTT